MNDQELIELVRQKTPEEFSLDEIELLRSRLSESETLRAELAGQVELDRYLAGHLGHVELPVDRIVARVNRRRWFDLRVSNGVLAVLLCLVLAAWIGSQWVLPYVTSEPNRPSDAHTVTALVPGTPPERRQNDEPSTGVSPEPEETPAVEEKDATDEPPPDSAQPSAVVAEPSPAIEQQPAPVAAASAKLPLTIEAEDFARGNVQTDRIAGAEGPTQFVYSAETPSFVEYEFQLAEPGELELRLRYASLVSRPLQLAINGRPVSQALAAQQTGGYLADDQRWYDEGRFAFVRGKNVIRLETPRNFPHLDRLMIAVAGSAPEVVQAEPPANPDAPPDLGPQPPAAPPPAVPPDPDTPWHAVLTHGGELPAFADVAFEPFDVGSRLPTAADLKHWFAAVPGQALKIRDAPTSQGDCGHIEGIARLQAPWRDDTALKFSLSNPLGLRLHVFRETSGITLIYYPQPTPQWVAYATTRQPQACRPATYVLAATDDDRSRQAAIASGSPMQLRHRDDELVLSCGDVVLLRAPLLGAPTEVYLEGRAAVSGLALIRTRDAPAAPLRAEPVVQVVNPADLQWEGQPLPEGAEFQRLPDGGVQLMATKNAASASISAPLSLSGVQMIVLQLETAGRASGVYLADSMAPPGVVARFGRDKKSNATSITWSSHDTAATFSLNPIEQRPALLAAEKVWLRFLLSGGTLKYWISQDGVHWGRALQPRQGIPAGSMRLGLNVARNATEARIRLERIEVRSLTRLESLAPAGVRQQAPALVGPADIAQWLVQAAAVQPADVDTGTWRRACALRTLGAGCSWPLAEPLLDRLLDEALRQDQSHQWQLALLAEAALLADAWQKPSTVTWLQRRYEKLARAARRQGNPIPLALLRRAWRTTPLWTASLIPPLDHSLVRAEILQLALAGRWAELERLCRQLQFCGRAEHVEIFRWAAVTAWRMQGSYGEPPAVDLKSRWQHPLDEELDKDAYNFLAELDAALESNAFADGCRMITTLNPQSTTGLAPAPLDPRLMVSPAVAVQLAMDQHPELREAMVTRYGKIAQLRVQQAMADADVAALRLATTRFPGTAALSDAYTWLGDHALASGFFDEALGLYRRAAATTSEPFRPELAPRARLAAAMLGLDQGAPVAAPVALGPWRMSAEEFEALVSEMRKKNIGVTGVDRAADGGPAPAASGFETHVRSRLDGDVGDRPDEFRNPLVKKFKLDWAGRQITTAIEGDTLYVNNRFQVAAYDLNNGQRRWQSSRLPGKRARAQDWSLVPMHLLVTGRHVIARQLMAPSPLLVCLDKSTGKAVWHAQLEVDQQLLSDPLLMQGRLLALTLAKTSESGSDSKKQLQLTAFDPETGVVVSDHPLVRMNETWQQLRVCQVTAVDEGIVATLGGAVLCCDLTGAVRWVRKEFVLPPGDDPASARQYHARPLLHEGRLFVTQPGVRTVDCLDPATGLLHWRQVLPDVQRLLGIAGQSLILQSADGLVSFDPTTGQILWTHELGDLMVAHLCGGPGGLLVVQRVEFQSQPNALLPRLVWLDPATGRRTATWLLEKLAHAEPFLGPLVAHQERLWALVGRGHTDGTRDLVEMIPKGEAEAVALPPREGSDDIWLQHVDGELAAATSTALRGWQLWGGVAKTKHRRAVHFLREAGDSQQALLLDVAADQPVVLARRIQVPRQKGVALRVRMGSEEPSVKLPLTVRLADNVLTARQTSVSARRDWQILQYDLAPYAGGTFWLTISVTREPGAVTRTVWDRVEIVY